MAIDQSALDRSLILRVTECVLKRSRSFFIYERLMAKVPENWNTTIGECYVLAHLVGFAAFFGAIPLGAPAWIFGLLAVLGIYRLLDIYSFQLKVVLVDAWKKDYRGLQSPRRNIILSFVNFLELIVIFAFVMRTIERWMDSPAFDPELTAKSDAFVLSVSTATAAGFAPAKALALPAEFAMIIEILLALILLAVVIALFLAATPTIRGQSRESNGANQ